jgi:hypothetical protein
MIVALPWLGCGGQHSRALVQPTARYAPPPQSMGQTELQAASPPSSDDDPNPEEAALSVEISMEPMGAPPPGALLGVKPDGTRVTAADVALRAGQVAVPAQAMLTSSMTVSEIRDFPENDPQGETIAVDGVDRAYRASLSYRQAVRFFDRSFATGGFEELDRTSTHEATVWSLRCPGGERAHVAVRNTSPTTIEVVEASRRESAPTVRSTIPTSGARSP